jgi:hypothetical protein
VYVSVRLLYERGKRLSTYAIKAQRPAVGCLLIETSPDGYDAADRRARLVDDAGADLVDPMHYARVTASGRHGMKIEGTLYRKKGRKDAYRDAQAWWVQAPPVLEPLIDHADRVRAAEEAFIARVEGDDESAPPGPHPCA